MTVRLAHVAGMPQRVTAGLGPHGESVRVLAHGNRVQQYAGGRVENVDHVVVAPGKPQGLAVGADIAHVRAAAAGDGPGGHHLPRLEVDHRDAAPALAPAGDHVGTPVRHVEHRAVAAGVETVGAHAGGNEADPGEAIAVDQEDARWPFMSAM